MTTGSKLAALAAMAGLIAAPLMAQPPYMRGSQQPPKVGSKAKTQARAKNKAAHKARMAQRKGT